jgi:hypothetical protein
MLTPVIGADCGEVKDAVQGIFRPFLAGSASLDKLYRKQRLMQGVTVGDLNPFVCLLATLFSVSGDEEDSPEAVYHVPQHSSRRQSTSAAGKTSAGGVLQGIAPRQLLEMDNHVFVSVSFSSRCSTMLSSAS